MKKKNIKLIFGLLVLVVGFTTCQNEIMEKWWVKGDDDPEYIALMKQLPILEVVKETVKEEISLPPGKVLQNIKIINIEYILFSGESFMYNGLPYAGATTNLTDAERKSNNTNILAMAEELRDFPQYQLILHGHANPVFGTDQEKGDLMLLSTNRALAVRAILMDLYDDGVTAFNNPPFGSAFTPSASQMPLNSSRLGVRGYGGGRNLGSASYAGLNRRVEMILIQIETADAP